MNSLPILKPTSRRLLGIDILIFEILILLAELALLNNHLAWRWQFCNVVSGLNLLLCPVILPAIVWFTLQPSPWRSLAKFFTVTLGGFYIFLTLLFCPFLLMQPPEKRYVLKNGDIISIIFTDLGATGGNVTVCRQRPFGAAFLKCEGRILRWCDAEVVNLPNGEQMLSYSGGPPVGLDEFFASDD